MSTQRIYLDNAATTPMDEEVVDLMAETMRQCYGNPSSIHFLGRETRILIEKARKSMAALLGCAPSELFFTSGGTESDNMICRYLVEQGDVQRIISSKLEHHAITHTLENLAQLRGIRVDWVKHNEQGVLDLKNLEMLLAQDLGTSNRTLVTLMHANNELGNLLDLEVVAGLCNKYQAFFHSDTVQTVGHVPLNLQELGIHSVSGSAHKFYGPKGVGFIYLRGGHSWGPLIQGGSQERNMRGGTENLAGIVGMARALEKAIQTMDERRQRLANLRDRLRQGLEGVIPGLEFNGDGKGPRLPHILSLSFPPHPKGEMLLFNLDIEGVCASGGSACSSGAQTRSHVMEALGVPADRTTVRFSLGSRNTAEEMDRVVEILRKIWHEA
ncbi:MAG: cysteine desulfurase [Cytophagia bacterium]|nr:cysteine desulfurase [Cytophagia bacterium]